MTSSKKNILLVLFILLVAVYVFQNEFKDEKKVKPQVKPMLVLDIENEIEVNEVKKNTFGTSLSASYSYNGELGKVAYALIEPQFDNPNEIVKRNKMHTASSINVGKHNTFFNLKNPCIFLSKCKASEFSIKIISINDYFKFVRSSEGFANIPSLFIKNYKIPLEWAIQPAQVRKETNQVDDLDVAIWFIDSNKRGSLRSAKKILDKIIIAEPENIQAYVELARYHMKTSWGTVGLKRAEDILNAAHSLDENYANILILRGYVYSHQRRYQLAEADFVKAGKLESDNLWLQTNWGGLYELQNNSKKALEYYQLAIDKERIKPSPNDRAKTAAFVSAKNILYKQNEMVAVNELMGKKVIQFSENSCFQSDWADFKLFELGEYTEALELALKGISGNCESKDYANRIYANALIAEWYEKETSGSDGSSSYIKALALDANWTSRLLRFSTSKTFTPILEKLLKEKIDIDEVDSKGYTALAYAAVRHNTPAITSLIKLGSDPNKLLNEEYSAFLLSVMYGGKTTIKAFIMSGKKLKTNFEGGIKGRINAQDILLERGFDDLASLLSGNA